MCIYYIISNINVLKLRTLEERGPSADVSGDSWSKTVKLDAEEV
jgi:hypothetical protein